MFTRGSQVSDVIQIPGGGTFCASTHEYRDANNVIVPSVTQIGDTLGFTDFDNVPGKTLEHKRQIGDAVHYACHLLDTNQDLDWSTVHAEVAPYVLAYLNFLDEMQFKVEESETPGIHVTNGMSYSFTRDKVGMLGSIPNRFVVELKCAYKEEAFWKYQLAGYDIATKRTRPDEYLNRLAVQLKPDGTYKTFPYENPRDKDKFLYMLAVVHTKIEEKVKWQKIKL
jgi:hypothetical protein